MTGSSLVGLDNFFNGGKNGQEMTGSVRLHFEDTGFDGPDFIVQPLFCLWSNEVTTETA
jgi:hypothetical protein